MNVKTNIKITKKDKYTFIDIIHPNESDFVHSLEYIAKEYPQTEIYSSIYLDSPKLYETIELLAKYKFVEPEIQTVVRPSLIVHKKNTIFNNPLEDYTVPLGLMKSLVQNYENIKNHTVNTCEMMFQLSENAIHTLKKMVGYIRFDKNQKEFTGHFHVKKVTYYKGNPLFIIDIPENEVYVGEKEEVEGSDKPITFHTHPKQAYDKYNIKCAWPSESDYRTIYELIVNLSGIFHILAGLEGIYVISLKKDNLINIADLKNKNGRNIKKIANNATNRKKETEGDPIKYEISVKNDKEVPFDISYMNWEEARSPFFIHTQIIQNKNKAFVCKSF